MVMESKGFYKALVFGANEVISHKDDLNRINVFPVADGDTGTNLSATMQALLRYIKQDDNLSVLFQTAAHGAFVGARGNSGIIFAQFMDFCSQEMPASPFVTISEFAETIVRSVEKLYQSIVNPTEGTILSVMKAWGRSLAANKNKCSNIEECINKAVEECRHTMLSTPQQLPVLKQYGVVDSGAKGFYCFLLGFQKSFCRSKDSLKPEALLYPEESQATLLELPKHPHLNSPFRYCCEMLLTGEGLNQKHIQQKLEPYGDSILTLGNKQQTKIHIHTNTPNLVFAQMSHYGKTLEPKIEDMLLQQSIRENKKSKIAIVTDSVADLPPDFILENQIFVIPFLIDIGGSSYLDRLTITEEEFTEQNKSVKHQPRSSLPPVLLIQKMFEFLTSHYKEILVLSVSSQLSGSYNLLCQFANRWENEHDDTKISVIDTRKNSGAQGLLVMEVCKMAQQGYTLAEIYEKLESLRENTNILVAVNTTRYFARSGRISRRAGFLAQSLHIKPVLGLDDSGRGITFGAAFTQKSLVRKISNIIKKEQENYTIKSFCVVHAQNHEGAQHFAKAIQNQTGCSPSYLTSISPIVQSIAGEKAIAVCYIRCRKDKK